MIPLLQKILALRAAARRVRADEDFTVAAPEKADSGDSRHVSVPFAGVVNPLVGEGDTVVAGQAVAAIEAMKMEAVVTAPRAGTVARLAIGDTRQAEGGDLLLVLR